VQNKTTGKPAASDMVTLLTVGADVSEAGRAVTDAAGRFVLAGIPSGRQQDLHFEGPQVDAHLGVEPLSDGQRVSITVRVSGNQALLAGSDDNRHETSVRGAIESISGDVLQVGGRRVITDAATQFLGRDNTPISLRDLQVGQGVEVEGTSQNDGAILARKVKRDDNGAPQDESGEVHLRGAIESLGAASLQVTGRRVIVDGSTRILDHNNASIPFSSLKVGDTVEVEGHTQSDNSVLAKKVKIEDGPESEPVEVRFKGAIEVLGSSSLQVAGRKVTVDGNTRILDRDNTPIPLSALKVGDTVEVEGTNASNNSVLAKKIKRDDN
jgi:hypothetical protein